jgi:probable HAF family extracellular repeat protein
MNSKTLRISALFLFVALAIPVQLAAQDKQDQNKSHTHHHYKLIDLSLGGPDSLFYGGTGPMNAAGMASSCANTPTLDPNYPNINPYFSAPLDGELYIQHVFLWENGVLSDLGTLPGGTSSCEQWISDTGLIVGGSTNGQIDPLAGVPEVHAALWFEKRVFDLGTLGGNESIAFAANNYGEVAGGAANKIADSNASFFFTAATQVHAVLWKNGKMMDLGTLGEGTDSMAYNVNELGQVAGMSFTNNTVNPTTGLPTVDPFLWENGKMIDLGSLGGVQSNQLYLNNKGQVVGYSDLVGDQVYHPFLWTEDKGMQDLGTLGGNFGQAWWVNDAGDVVGQATTEGDQVLDAFLWRDGVMTDLGALAGDAGSYAQAINAGGQIVGQSIASQGYNHAFLWENNGPMVNLQDLVVPGSEVIPVEATFINDGGEIAANGFLPNGDRHAILLIPCDENHPAAEGCDYSLVDSAAATQENSAPAMHEPSTTVPRTLRPLGRRGLASPWQTEVTRKSAVSLTEAKVVPINGTPQSTTINTTFPEFLRVKATLANGQPISDAQVILTAPAQTGASATFANGATKATAWTDDRGISNPIWVNANGKVGTYTVTASIGAGATRANFSLTNTL